MRTASRGLYIATCQPYDDEMRERIARHRTDREQSGFSWETTEEPLQAAALLNRMGEQFTGELHKGQKPPVVLLDCLTLWLTNWLMNAEHEVFDEDQEQLADEIEKLLEAISRYPYPLLIVTNEVGDGIVPAYPLGRRFRDEAGRLNQKVAALCERVFLVTAGIPVELKSQAFRWDQL